MGHTNLSRFQRRPRPAYLLAQNDDGISSAPWVPSVTLLFGSRGISRCHGAVHQPSDKRLARLFVVVPKGLVRQRGEHPRFAPIEPFRAASTRCCGFITASAGRLLTGSPALFQKSVSTAGGMTTCTRTPLPATSPCKACEKLTT